jgi:hypothetical protein
MPSSPAGLERICLLCDTDRKIGDGWPPGGPMCRRSKKSCAIRFIAVITGLTGIFLASTGAGASALASEAALSRTSADIGCNARYPHRVPFTYGNGVEIPDLVACTDYFSTSINNISTDVIWHVYQPKLKYWTIRQDVSIVPQEVSVESITTVLYRLWITGAIKDPYLTIEPGTDAVIPDPPGDIKLGHGAGEEAAWQAMSLMADSISDKTHDAIVDLLEDDQSPTAKAIIECANTAYTLGQGAYDASQSQDIASQLSGMFESGSQCAEAVTAAKEAGEHAEVPEVNLENVHDEIRLGDDAWGDTDTLVDDVVRFIEDGLLAHELG